MSVMRRAAIDAVRAWTRLYTLGLPAALRAERRADIESDLWESQHAPVGATAAQIVARLLFGVIDDVTWRFEAGGIMSVRVLALAVGGAVVAALLVIGAMFRAASPAPPAAPKLGWHVTKYPSPPPPPPPPCRLSDPKPVPPCK